MQLKRLYGVNGCAADVCHAVCSLYGSSGSGCDGTGGQAEATEAAAEAPAGGEAAAAPAADIKIGLVTDVGRVNDRSLTSRPGRASSRPARRWA